MAWRDTRYGASQVCAAGLARGEPTARDAWPLPRLGVARNINRMAVKMRSTALSLRLVHHHGGGPLPGSDPEPTSAPLVAGLTRICRLCRASTSVGSTRISPQLN